MGWRRPLLGLDPAPAVREPERGALVAAVGDELQQLPVGDQPIGEPVGLEPLLVAGQPVVEPETGLGGVTLVPDLDQAAGDVTPTLRSPSARRRPPPGTALTQGAVRVIGR